MKVVLGYAKEIGGELAALGGGGVRLGEAQGQDRREVLATAQLRRMEGRCGRDGAQDAG